MSGASQQQLSHADRHDLDKLGRWRDGLESASGEGGETFPACAIFLVSPEDRASHDIFREYRSAFEELGGGFHHLVIFGQHGISSTQVAFLGEVCQSSDSVPLLAVASLSGGSDPVICFELPKGDRDGDLDATQTWGIALESVRSAILGGAGLALGEIQGARIAPFRSGSLSEAVESVFRELGD